jgi:hypothetical protein
LQEDKDMTGNYDELEAALKAEVTTIDEVKKAAIEKALKNDAEKQRQTEAAEKEAADAKASPEPVKVEKK